MRIVLLSIKNFRGIRSLEWSPPPGVTCLVGRGDSGKTTILDAIELALLPRYRAQFVDSDFHGGATSEPIEIRVTVVDLPEELLRQNKFGLELQGWSPDQELHDEPEDEDTLALTVRLTVDEALEPIWHVVNGRNEEGRVIGPRDRGAIGAVRLGDASARQLSWVSGSSLARVSDSPDAIGAALSKAYRNAWEAVSELEFEDLTRIAVEAGKWGTQYGSHADLPLGVGLEPRNLNIGAGSLTLRQSTGVSASALGTGSRRLLGLAIQRQAVGKSVVSLVDEVEAGLEPHRLRHVLRELQTSSHQALLVSHSPVAIAELGTSGLAIVRKRDDGTVEVRRPQDSLQGVVRAMPEALLGRRVIVCEGKTEYGMGRALVAHWDKQQTSPLATMGTVLAPGDGSEAPRRAAALQELGYETIYWADGDVVTNPSLSELRGLGVATVIWDGSMNTEQRLMEDATEALLQELWDIAVDERDAMSVSNQLSAMLDRTGRPPGSWKEWEQACPIEDLRRALGGTAAKKGWYKNTSAGSALVKPWPPHYQNSRTPTLLRNWRGYVTLPTVTDPQALVNAQRAFVIAPAGCGKTELIARAIELDEGRSLVLTHTHSGVNALRSRLSRLGVPATRFHVATIAGLGLRYAAAYPALSGLAVASPTGDEWPQVYSATIELLRHRVVRDVLERSYSGVYVDEYQDCDFSQHSIVMAVAEVLPCRLLGDPLQGIFDFAGQAVDWREHVEPQFERLPNLRTPHRWRETNPDLGEWLTAIRPLLASGDPVDLSLGPSQRLATSPANQRAACYQASAKRGQSVVAIGKWPSDCHNLAGKLGGTFGSMEELDCRDLMKFARALDNASSGHARAVLLLDFASSCFTVVGSRLAMFREQYASGQIPDTRRLTVNRDAVESLNRVATEATVSSLLAAARILDRMPGARLYRRELWREMKTTLGTQVGHPEQGVAVTAWQVRDRARRVGRRPEQRVVSRTLLVKGLEFDHAIVTDIDSLTAKEAYVAMTRGRTSLTVLSGKPVIQKDPVTNMLD